MQGLQQIIIPVVDSSNDLFGWESWNCFYLIIQKVRKVYFFCGAKVTFYGLLLSTLGCRTSFSSYSSSSSRRHLNWTLKSLKVGYGREDDQPPLESFTPPLRFPQSSLEFLLEGEARTTDLLLAEIYNGVSFCLQWNYVFHWYSADGLLLSQSRQRILCLNTLKTALKVWYTFIINRIDA